ncbi:MAG: glycosyltransferase [Nitrospirae bacterium]|nr:glycosyltransferase [Nitrospirota bacterium]
MRSLQRDYRPVLIYARHNHLIADYAASGVELVNIPLDPRLTGVYRDAVRFNPRRLVLLVLLYLKAIPHVVRAVRQYRIQILHPVDNLSKLIAGVAGRIAGVKVVAHCHDDLGSTFIERMLRVYQLVFMHRIIAVSQTIARRFTVLGRLPRKVATIYNGVDLAMFDPARVGGSGVDDGGSAARAVTIGMIALFDGVKGHRFLFRALASLKAKGSGGWRCVLVGDGREKAALLKEVDALNLSDRVTFLGYRRDVPELLRSIDILVVPSERESFGMAAVEAMAMQVPVVASDVGGLSEVIEHGKTGFLVPPRDPLALAEAIETLICSPALRVEMGRRGRQRVEQYFSLEKNVASTKALYDELLQGVAPG